MPMLMNGGTDVRWLEVTLCLRAPMVVRALADPDGYGRAVPGESRS